MCKTTQSDLENSSDFWATYITSAKLDTNHGQKYARILQPFLFWELC